MEYTHYINKYYYELVCDDASLTDTVPKMVLSIIRLIKKSGEKSLGTKTRGGLYSGIERRWLSELKSTAKILLSIET